MPKLNFAIPHSLSKEDARHKLERFAESMKGKFQDQVSELEESWEGDKLNFGFKTFGISIQGDIAVGESDLAVVCELPFSAMLFKGKIESGMREQLGRLMK